MIQMNNRLSFPKLKARDIIKSLNIRYPEEIEVEDIAYVRHLLVRERILNGSDGRLVRKGNWGIATINRNIPELGRKRFAISHELGHFELHENANPVRLCNEKDFLWWGKIRPEEKEANEFAAELLMPEFLFQPLCKSIIPCFDDIAYLADQFRTSLTATAIRYVECSPYSCAIVTSQNKIIKWYAHSEDFPYYINVGSELDHDTVAFDFFSGKELSSSMESVIAKAWIDSDRINRDAMINEQAIALKRYNMVLSIIWAEEDIEN